MTTTSLSPQYAFEKHSDYLSVLKHFIFDNSSITEPYCDLTYKIVTNSHLDKEIAENKEISHFNKSELLKLLNHQYRNYSQYITSGSYFSLANQVINLISILDYNKCAVEITPDNSLFFNLKFENDITTHIEFYFKPHGGNTKEAFYTIYKGDNIIAEGYGNIKDVVYSIESEKIQH